MTTSNDNYEPLMVSMCYFLRMGMVCRRCATSEEQCRSHVQHVVSGGPLVLDCKRTSPGYDKVKTGARDQYCITARLRRRSLRGEPGVMNSRVFWLWFAIGAIPFWIAYAAGAVLAALNMRSLLDFVQFALQIFSIPGIIVSLPFLDLVASPWWSIGVIGIMNGAAYGFSAWLIARLVRKRCSAKW